MTDKKIDVVALGTCYVDTNVNNFPFTKDITDEELVGGQYETVPGGSAVNFCRLGSSLGLQTTFIGMAGADTNADTLQNLLSQQGVQTSLIRQSALQTNISFNITNPEGEHLMLVAGTANAALDPAVVLPRLQTLLPETNMLYLGGCLKLKNFVGAFDEIARLAHQSSAKLAIDHGRVPVGTSAKMLEAVKMLVLNADYYFPSHEEFCTLWDVSDIETGLLKLKDLAPNLVVVVKDGSRGAFYHDGASVQNIHGEKVEKIVNATGAGDSFNAGVIAALLKDFSLENAVAFGCKVAAAKIQMKHLPTL